VAPAAPWEADVDGTWVGQRAAHAARFADEVRQIADRARRASDAQWESAAAAAFRRILDAEGRRLLAVAGAIDDAAAALRAHAGAVEALGEVPVLGSLARRLLP
jgi:hypothetical protein